MITISRIFSNKIHIVNCWDYTWINNNENYFLLYLYFFDWYKFCLLIQKNNNWTNKSFLQFPNRLRNIGNSFKLNYRGKSQCELSSRIRWILKMIHVIFFDFQHIHIFYYLFLLFKYVMYNVLKSQNSCRLMFPVQQQLALPFE